jgi:regulator of RNase E activity RraA
MSGGTTSRAAPGQTVRCGGVEAAPGHVVFGDDDGVVIASAEQVAAALKTAEQIMRAERAMLAGMAEGRSLHEQTNHAEHVAALDAGEDSGLAFRA